MIRAVYGRPHEVDEVTHMVCTFPFTSSIFNDPSPNSKNSNASLRMIHHYFPSVPSSPLLLKRAFLYFLTGACINGAQQLVSRERPFVAI